MGRATSRLQLTQGEPRHTMGCILCTMFLGSACTISVQVSQTMLGVLQFQYKGGCQAPHDSLQNHWIVAITRPVSSCSCWLAGPSSFGTVSINATSIWKQLLLCQSACNKGTCAWPPWPSPWPSPWPCSAWPCPAWPCSACSGKGPQTRGSNVVGYASKGNKSMQQQASHTSSGIQGRIWRLTQLALWKALKTCYRPEQSHYFQISTVYHENLKLRSAWTSHPESASVVSVAPNCGRDAVIWKPISWRVSVSPNGIIL